MAGIPSHNSSPDPGTESKFSTTSGTGDQTKQDQEGPSESNGLSSDISVEENGALASLDSKSQVQDTEKELYTTTSQGPDSQTSVRDCVVKMLDEIDERVDKLRADAMKLENERDDVLSSLDAMFNAQIVYDLKGIDLDEVNRYIERLARRCMAIQVDIKSERSPPQLEALNKVNNLIDNLIRDLKKDVPGTRRRCIAYINSCSEQLSEQIQDIDSIFEIAVLGCSVEDQKRIKKRLTGLFSYFNTCDGRPNSIATISRLVEIDEAEIKEAIDRSLESK